ncbi:MAG: BamA/TamA family outer membrane protein [Bacteroidales bacterium]|nr:BamA/TamA family outer membrane protein [Bacteroidales bacterium]
MKRICLYNIFMVLLVSCSQSIAQQNHTLQIVSYDDHADIHKEIPYKNNVKSIEEAVFRTRSIVHYLHKKGYLTAGFDSMTTRGDTITAYLFLGETYPFGQIRVNDKDLLLLSMTGLKKEHFNVGTDYVTIASYLQKIQQTGMQNGYPFIAVKLDSLTIQEDTISGNVHIERNQYYVWDTIQIRGDRAIKNNTLQHILGIKPGKPFDIDLVEKIDDQLKELNFIEKKGEISIIFTHDNKARLVIELQKGRTGNFNGLAGILPDNTNKNKLALTGELTLHLVNAFGYAEMLSANWSGIKGSQVLELKYGQPYIFDLPFGVQYHFNLFKRDTTYITLAHRFGLTFKLRAHQTLTTFYGNERSNVIDRSVFSASTILPPWSDYITNIFGIDFSMQRFDYRQNPRRGVSLACEVSAGKKRLRKKPDIPPTLFEGIETNTQQIIFRWNNEAYIPLFKRSALRFMTRGGSKISNQLFDNESFLFGGINSLRGFDEKSLSGTSWALFSMEYRFLFEKDAHVNLFADIAWYEKNLLASYRRDTPFGFGIGLAFPTPAGIIMLSYAYGKEQNNPIDFKSAKIHIGLLSLF